MSQAQKDKLRILVVDDSPVYVRFLSQILKEIPETAAVETAASAEEGLVKTGMFNPDLVLLDYRLPKMDGLGALRRIKIRKPNTAVIILSSVSSQAAAITVEALKLGALEFLAKPNMHTCDDPQAYLRERISKVISVVLTANSRGKIVEPSTGNKGLRFTNSQKTSPKPKVTKLEPGAISNDAPFPGSIQAVALGISTGGPAALHALIPRLPRDLDCPIFIVQHMPPHFTRELAQSLNSESAVTVMEAQHGDSVQPGFVYIAPGGHHMRLAVKDEQTYIQITDEEPELFCRPSVNKLMRDVGAQYGRRALGVIMTGMGKDGLDGLQTMRGHGAYLIGQDEQSSLIYSMPYYPVQEGLLQEAHNPVGLADRIVSLAGCRRIERRSAEGTI